MSDMYGIGRQDSRSLSRVLPAASEPAAARIIRDFIALQDSGLSPEERMSTLRRVNSCRTIPQSQVISESGP